MSALSDALGGIKQLLLLQNDVRTLEKALDKQETAIRDLATDVVALDKRVVRIETMVEVAATRAPSRQPRLPKE